VLIGFMPRLTIRHTSTREKGQIYMPQINAFLYIGVLALVLGFRSSSNMASAYGIAVTGDMLATSMLAYLYLRHCRNWGRLSAGLIIAGFLVIDVAFFISTLIKVPEGGWVSLMVGAFVFTIMSTWVRQREIAHKLSEADALPLADFVARIAAKKKSDVNGSPSRRRVPGTAIFLSQRADVVPHALLHNLKHNHVLHERIAIVTVMTEDQPWVPLDERIEFEKLGAGFYRIIARYGFMQSPNVPAVLEHCEGREGFTAEAMTTSYFFGRDKFVSRASAGLGRWRETLFIFLQRNAISAADFFRIPPNRTVELGTQIEI
jgi:KUP system potassium uptake protein